MDPEGAGKVERFQEREDLITSSVVGYIRRLLSLRLGELGSDAVECLRDSSKNRDKEAGSKRAGTDEP